MTDQPDALLPDLWLIMKGGAFYRPNAQGYTRHVSEAWMLPKTEAEKHINTDPMHRVTIHHVSEYARPPSETIFPVRDAEPMPSEPKAKAGSEAEQGVQLSRPEPTPPTEALELARELETLGNELEAVGIVSNRLEKVRALLARPTAAPEDAGLPTQAWCFDMEKAPRDEHILAVVKQQVRIVRWGKTSHVPFYGFCLADQGAEYFDLCEPTHWMPLPAPPTPARGQP